MSGRQVCYEYDGTFGGFLTCVFESYRNKEEPVCFLRPEDDRYTLWETRRVDTREEQAKRVWRGVVRNVSPSAAELASRGFLTCLEEKELHLWRFLRYAFQRGSRVMADLGDDRVDVLRRAVQHLNEEAHLYTGFVRFSDYDGVLLGEIEPKNRVLPLLRPHFTQRYNTEAFLLYDRTHKEALVHRPGQWAIVPMEEFSLAPPGEGEREYRRLWRQFFETVSIEGRYNPRCQNTHLPKRYRAMMTEFREEQGTALPEKHKAPIGLR